MQFSSCVRTSFSSRYIYRQNNDCRLSFGCQHDNNFTTKVRKNRYANGFTNSVVQSDPSYPFDVTLNSLHFGSFSNSIPCSSYIFLVDLVDQISDLCIQSVAGLHRRFLLYPGVLVCICFKLRSVDIALLLGLCFFTAPFFAFSGTILTYSDSRSILRAQDTTTDVV